MHVRDKDKSIPLSASIERYFASGEKLGRDCLNMWTIIDDQLAITERDGLNFESLPVAQHYEEYISIHVKDVRRIMELSDPEAVVAMNRLVDEYNADLDRIKRERDSVAVKVFIARATQLVNLQE